MLSNILTNKSIWKVFILYSYGEGSGYTWSEIREYTKLQNKSLKIALKTLLFYKILNKNKRIYKLNLENQISLSIMNLIKDEKKRLNFPNFELYIALIIMLEKVQMYEIIDEIYLFGSHAKKMASKNSDIDIAIITGNINFNLTKEKIQLEEKYRYNFQFHIHKFGNDKLSEEIKKHGVKLV